MEIPQTIENFCAVIATTEQESDFRADPSVPGLPDIAWREIDKQSERIGMPKLVVQKALKMQSSDGKTYSERLDTVQTERQLSELFEDFIGRVPMGKTFFAARNPGHVDGEELVCLTEVRLRDLARSVGRILFKQALGVTRRGLRLIGVRARA